MAIKEIKISPLFEKRYKKLPKKVKEKAKEKEKIFRENPFHPILKTHKLHGKEKERKIMAENLIDILIEQAQLFY
jgi:mRNA-degrading endonuclease RelE of RelBE toxin-antitoxin system